MNKLALMALSGGRRLLTYNWGPMLTHKTVFYNSQEGEMFMGMGHLEVRNSDTLELKLYKLKTKDNSVEPVSIQVGANSSLQ